MIGIFDSGMGGLTVLRALRAELPSCDVVYFGDTKNAPYGVKTQSELSQLTVRGLSFLQERGATSIISACNSVSASLALSLYDALSLNPSSLVEMVGPTIGFFKNKDVNIVLCATTATINSRIYHNAFQMIGKDIRSFDIPTLAGAIEQGAPDAEIENIIKDSINDMRFAPGDILILACTHYPLVEDAFRRVVGPDVRIFDPAYAVAERAEKLFFPKESGEAKTTFILSRESEPFRRAVKKLFPAGESAIEIRDPSAGPKA